MSEYCKDIAFPVVRECPDCIDKFMTLAYKYEDENNKLKAEMEKAKRIHEADCNDYADLTRKNKALELQVADYRGALHTILGEAANSDEMVGVAQRVLAKYGDLIDSRKCDCGKIDGMVCRKCLSCDAHCPCH